MKKGQEYTGTVERVKFPNKGIVRVVTEDGDHLCTVKNTISGQKVRFRVTKKKNQNIEGHLLEVIESSPLEIKSPCPHFGVCGGCSYQNLPYKEQLTLKERQVQELL